MTAKMAEIMPLIRVILDTITESSGGLFNETDRARVVHRLCVIAL